VDNPADRDRLEQLPEPTGVVGLAVADHDRREGLHTQLAKPLCNPAAGWPGVDQHRVPLRRVEQDRVALADVEHPHDQIFGGCGRLVARPEEDDCREQRADEGYGDGGPTER
jgi:hypothetical protein